MRFLKKLRRKRPEFVAPIEPAAPFFAVGDIHGRDDLLVRFLEGAPDDQTLVFVGDYIDRGEQSAAVLRRLMDLQQTRGDRVVCLAGNHEAFLSDFLAGSRMGGSGWLRHGGLQTLASFGVPIPVGDDVTAESWTAARLALTEAMGQHMQDWLRDLPVMWQSGNVCVVHAGADPRKPMDDQSRGVLVWGHEAFEREPRIDGNWIVHGHTIVPEPQISGGRIAIDTGAYASGRLTAVQIAPGRADFVTIR